MPIPFCFYRQPQDLGSMCMRWRSCLDKGVEIWYQVWIKFSEDKLTRLLYLSLAELNRLKEKSMSDIYDKFIDRKPHCFGTFTLVDAANAQSDWAVSKEFLSKLI